MKKNCIDVVAVDIEIDPYKDRAKRFRNAVQSIEGNDQPGVTGEFFLSPENPGHYLLPLRLCLL